MTVYGFIKSNRDTYEELAMRDLKNGYRNIELEGRIAALDLVLENLTVEAASCET
jgi:hypothetical protein